MRSKEVEKAIKVMQKDIKDYKAELEIELEDRIDEQRIAYLHQQTTSYETVLSYIEQLEKMTPTPENEVPVEYQTVVFVDKRDAVMKSEIKDKIEKAKIKLANIGGEIQGKELVKISKTAYKQIRLEERITILKMLLGESDEK